MTCRFLKDLLQQVQSAGSCMKDEGGYKWMEFNYLFEWLENSEIDVSESSFIIYVLPFICMDYASKHAKYEPVSTTNMLLA